MKIATLDLTPELLVAFCKASKDGPPRRFIVKENPLPEDAEIVRVGLSPPDLSAPSNVRLYLKSEQFEDVADDALPPEVPRILFETIFDAS